MRVAPLIAVAAILALTACAGDDAAFLGVELDRYDFGGDFELIDQAGSRFTDDDLRGRTSLLFFGFTECPDACPTTMSKIVRVHQQLDEPANLETVLVSVDPETDRPEVLASYLERYPVPAVGLTGSREELEKVALSFGASFQEVDPHAGHGDHAAGGGARKVSHSLYLYLLDEAGEVRAFFAPDVEAESIAATVRALWQEVGA